MAEKSDPHISPFPPPTDLTRVRQIKEIVKRLFGGRAEQESFEFFAGDVLVREGQALSATPALLILEGEIHERVTDFIPGQGAVEQTWHVAHPGDIVNVQAILPSFKNQPALSSLHVMADGRGFVLREDQLPKLHQFGILLANLFRNIVMLLNKDREHNRVYGGFLRLSEQIRRRHPDFTLPHSPTDIVQRFAELKRERDQIVRHADALLAKLRQADERLAAHNLERGAFRTSMEKMRQELADLQTQITESQNEQGKLAKKLDFERRTREALEKRTIELIRELAERSESTPSQSRFPNTMKVLESRILEELEEETRMQREAAERYHVLAHAAEQEKADYENRARLLHKAMELLAQDNPELMLREDVMRLMIGEEPPPRPASDLPLSDEEKGQIIRAVVPKRPQTVPYAPAEDRLFPPEPSSALTLPRPKPFPESIPSPHIAIRPPAPPEEPNIERFEDSDGAASSASVLIPDADHASDPADPGSSNISTADDSVTIPSLVTTDHVDDLPPWEDVFDDPE